MAPIERQRQIHMLLSSRRRSTCSYSRIRQGSQRPTIFGRTSVRRWCTSTQPLSSVQSRLAGRDERNELVGGDFEALAYFGASPIWRGDAGEVWRDCHEPLPTLCANGMSAVESFHLGTSPVLRYRRCRIHPVRRSG